MLIKTFKLLLFFLILHLATNAQSLSVDADLRPRFEYRHGYGNLFPDAADPAAFVTQRPRLNLRYAKIKQPPGCKYLGRHKIVSSYKF